jgi:hypothetical protein
LEPNAMDKYAGTWGTVVARLGNIAEDRRPNVRSNMAILAGSLAPEDPEALEGLADIGTETIWQLLRDKQGAAEIVLAAVLDERRRLTPDLQTQLSDRIRERLMEAISETDADITSEDLLRLRRDALVFVPVGLIAETIVSDARRLATNWKGKGDPVERDRLVARLRTLQGIEAGGLTEQHAYLRSALGACLKQLSRGERKLVLFVLLRCVPTLLDPLPDGSLLVSRRSLEAAARVGRPRWITLAWQAAAGSIVTSLGLLLLVGLALAVGEWQNKIAVVEGAGSWLSELVFVGIAASLPVALVYAPSLNRRLRVYSRLRRALVAGIAGSVGITVSVLPFVLDHSATAALGLAVGSSEWPILAVLFAASVATFTLAIAVVPVAVRAAAVTREEYRRWHAIVLSIAPAVAMVTLICGAAWLAGVTLLSQLWPLLIVSCVAIAFVVVAIEFTTWPSRVLQRQKQLPRWLRAATVAAVIPLVLPLIGVARFLTLTLPQLNQRYDLTRTDDLNFSARPGQPVTLSFDAGAPLRLDFTPDNHKIEIKINGKTSLGHEFRVQDATRSQVCVDECEPSMWPNLDHWLPTLVLSSRPPVDIRVRPVRIAANAIQHGTVAPVRLSLNEAGSGVVTLAAGNSALLTLPAEKNLLVVAKGMGDMQHTVMVALYRTDKQDRIFPRDQVEGEDHFSRDLGAGEYRLCVYFGEADVVACDDAEHNPPFEPGSATLQITGSEAESR